MGDIADLLSRLPIEDRNINAERFFKALAYNVLIGGTDAHAKNYSLVLIGSRAQVSPLYDIASAAPYEQQERLQSSMKIGDHWKMLDVTASDWRTVGRRLGIPATKQSAGWTNFVVNFPLHWTAPSDHYRPLFNLRHLEWQSG